MLRRTAFNTIILAFIASVSHPYCSAAEEQPLEVAVGKAQVGRYERVELSVTGIKDYDTPINTSFVQLDASIVSPSGAEITVPGFAMHQTKAVSSGNQNAPKYVPTGAWLWKIRYAPTEAGTYKGVVTVTEGETRRQSKLFEFKVATSSSKGNIHVSKTNPFAFQYDDGSLYIPIGMNLCWANNKPDASRLQRYEAWLKSLAANECNYIRIWLGSNWCFGLHGPDSEKPYDLNEDAAELMDKILLLCEEKGIAIKMCMGNNIRSYKNLKPSGGQFTQQDKQDFFTDSEARKRWKALCHYIVARWGASTSVLAWEMWNEMDDNFGAYANNKKIVAWTNEMCRYVKAIDPHKHLTTNSLGGGKVNPSLWSLDSVDFVQYHEYGGKRKNMGLAQYEIYAEPLANLRKFGKPVLLAECGINRETHQKDAQGYGLHEVIWIGFFSGASGTGMNWWWDSAIENHAETYYPQYKYFAAFVKNLPLLKEPFPPIEANTTPDNLKAYARAASWGAVAWVVNTNDKWRALVNENKKPEAVTGGKLTIPVKAPGNYNVEFFHPWTGKVVEKKTAAAADDKTLSLNLPEFKIDLAVKALKAN